jgi:hypothetical protein
VAGDLPAGADSPEVEAYTESAEVEAESVDAEVEAYTESPEVEAEDARAIEVPVRTSVPGPVFGRRELMKDLISEGPSETGMPAKLTDRSGENYRIKISKAVFSPLLRKSLKKPIPIMMAR